MHQSSFAGGPIEPAFYREILNDAGLGIAAVELGTQPSFDGHLADFLDPVLPLAQRLPDDLEQRLPAVAIGRESDAVRALLLDPAADDVVRHEAANLLRRSGDPDLAATLIVALADAANGERMRGYALQHLGIELLEDRAGEADSIAREVLLVAFRRDLHLEVRREAFLALTRLQHSEALRLLDDLRHPGLQGMTDLVLVAWQEQDRRQFGPFLPKLFDHDNESVAVAAIALAGAWRVSEAESALTDLADHDSARIRRAAGVALSRFDPEPKNSAP